MAIPENEHIEVTINMKEDAIYIELSPMEGGVDFQVHGLKPSTEIMAMSAGILHILTNKPELINQAITDYMADVAIAEKKEKALAHSREESSIQEKP